MVELESQSDSSNSRKVPRNYFSRREQIRLMMMVFSLMLVLVLMMEAAKPSNWNWFFNLGNANAENTDTIKQSNGSDSEDINTRLPRKVVPVDNGIKDEIRIAQQPKPKKLTPFTMNQNQESSQPTYLAGIQPEYFEPVEDNTFFISKDTQAWENTVNTLAEIESSQLKKATVTPAQFIQLFRQPEVYRGKLVELQGDIRRVRKVKARNQNLAVDHYWQLWLFSERHNSPITIYCLELPQDFPQGESTYEQVKLRGIFFKIWAYSANGGTMRAPLVVAKQLTWLSPKTQTEFSSSQVTIGISIAFVFAVFCAGFVYFQTRGKPSQVEKFIRDKEEQRFRESSDQIDSGVSVRDQLKLLSEQLQADHHAKESEEEDS